MNCHKRGVSLVHVHVSSHSSGSGPSTLLVVFFQLMKPYSLLSFQINRFSFLFPGGFRFFLFVVRVGAAVAAGIAAITAAAASAHEDAAGSEGEDERHARQNRVHNCKTSGDITGGSRLIRTWIIRIPG